MPESTPPRKKVARKAPATAAPTLTADTPIPIGREAQRKVVSAQGWKKTGSTTQAIELELPSGNTILAKRPGLMNLLRENVLPDVLSMMAQQQVDAAKGKPGAEEQSFNLQEILEKDGPEGVAKIFESFDRIAAYSVVEPELRFHKEEVEYEGGETGWELIAEEDRDPDVVYTDQVSEDDRIFIGQWAMSGQAEIASFRS